MRFFILLCSLALAQSSFAAQPKEWTFLLFLNGNNNLDKFGEMNLNQIEKVGSTDKINIVVQWASLKNGKVQRYLIQKDGNEKTVTSPVIQDLGKADMGDWHTLVDFVQWGAKNFPANHYFVDVWDHGSGWHSVADEESIVFKDISSDETTGHHMTTKQLAQALNDSAKAIGHKIDVYGSDACLMGMVEIAAEVADSVSIYAGSQELEPGKGWPYDAFFARWNALPGTASAKEVAKILSEEYAKSYRSTSSKVTFSAFDLNEIPDLYQSMRALGTSLKNLRRQDLRPIAKSSQSFYNADYVDFMDFLSRVKAENFSRIDSSIYSEVEQSANRFIIANNTVGYPDAHGMSIWIPAKRRIYSKFSDLYSQMIFDQQTHWSEVAKLIAE